MRTTGLGVFLRQRTCSRLVLVRKLIEICIEKYAKAISRNIKQCYVSIFEAQKSAQKHKQI